METTVEVKTVKNKIKKQEANQANQNGYLGINKYDGMPNNPVKFKNWNEYKEWKYKIYGKDMPEKYLALNRFETIPALDRDLEEIENGEVETCNTWEEFVELMKKWDEEND